MTTRLRIEFDIESHLGSKELIEGLTAQLEIWKKYKAISFYDYNVK